MRSGRSQPHPIFISSDQGNANSACHRKLSYTAPGMILPTTHNYQGNPNSACHRKLSYTAPGGLSIFTAPSCAPAITNVMFGINLQVQVKVGAHAWGLGWLGGGSLIRLAFLPSDEHLIEWGQIHGEDTYPTNSDSFLRSSTSPPFLPRAAHSISSRADGARPA